jgi:hypothetical protein
VNQKKETREWRKKVWMTVGFLLFVLIVGLISGYWVEQHWVNKETIRDNGKVHYVADAKDPDSVIEGNDRDTGILPLEDWEDQVIISDSDHSLTVTNQSAAGQQGTAMETVGHNLARGTYTVTISYQASEDGNEAVVYLPQEMDTDAEAGESGAVVARIALPAGQETARATFSLRSAQQGVKIQVRYQAGDLTINEITTQDTGFHTDQLWNLMLLLIFLAILIYLLGFRYAGEEHLESKAVVFLLMIAMLYSCLPLMNDFLFDGHDIEFHLGRLDGIAQAMENGQFPMYLNMAQHNGYGEATPVMYPQVFLVLPAFLMCAGMSLMNAYKLMLASISVMGLLIAYFSFEGVFRSRGTAVTAALAYHLCIYRLADIYTREALGEALAMCFLPLVFFGFYEIYVGEKNRWSYLALGLTGVISSHVLTTVMVGFLAGIFFILLLPYLWKNHRLRRIVSLIKAGILTLVLNLYLLIPLADYYLHENFNLLKDQDEGLVVNATGAYISQIFGIFYSGNSKAYSKAYGQTSGEMVLSIGLLLVATLFAFLWIRCAYRTKPEQKKLLNLGNVAMTGALLSIFLSLWIAPWQGIAQIPILNKLKSVQMIWRFLTLATMFCSVVLGCVLLFLADRKPKWKKAIYGITICAAFACSFYYMDSLSENISYYDRTLVNECGDDKLYLRMKADYGMEEARTVRSSVEGTMISGYQRNETAVSFSYSLPEGTDEAVLSAPLYYFTGYTATLDGAPIQVMESDHGLASVTVTKSTGTISFVFTPKRSWIVAGWLSLAAWILCAGYVARIGIQRRRKNGIAA